MVCVQLRIRPRKRNVQNSLGFWDTNGSPNLGQTTILSDTKQKNNLQNCGLCRSGWPLCESEGRQKDKYLDLAKNWKKKKKTRNLKVTARIQKKSSGDLRGLAVTQTSLENHQLTLIWRTFKRVKNNMKNYGKNYRIRKWQTFQL